MTTTDFWNGRPSRRLLDDRRDLLLLVVLALVALAVRAVPVLLHGGLFGLLGYDDGVYFGAAVAFVHGVVPYRDFLLLHPPGIVLALSPFAALGTVTGDPTAFALARLAIMLLGAANAVLVALIAGRYGRLAGLTAGALYAVWNTAANVERSTDLHAPQNALLLLGLLALTRPGRIGSRRAALAGVALGLATTVQLWQGVAVLVVLWWVVVRARGEGRDRLRPVAAYVAGAGLAFGLVCLPFLLAAPWAMVRYTLLDQIGRQSMGVDIVDRLRVLEGLHRATGHAVVPDALVVVAAGAGLTVLVVTAWRCVWTRMWAALAIAQWAVVLATPSFFNDYPSLMAPPATLVLGTGVAACVGGLTRRRLRFAHAAAPVAVGLLLLALVSTARGEGEPLPLRDLERDVATARCVTADSPALLVLTSAMRHNIEAGCLLVLDPSGVSYDTGNGRRRSPAYQEAMVAWYASGDAALFVRPESDGLTAAAKGAIEQQLPVERRRGIVTVCLPSP